MAPKFSMSFFVWLALGADLQKLDGKLNTLLQASGEIWKNSNRTVDYKFMQQKTVDS